MQNTVNSQDEIDLLELLAKCYTSLKKNFVLVIALPLVGVLTVFLVNRIERERVFSEMMVVTSLMSRGECDFLMKQFENSYMPGSGKKIAPGIQSLSHQIEVSNDAVLLKIDAIVENDSVLNHLQNEIVDYLNASEPVAREMKNSRIYYSRLIKKIDEELDSLQQVKKEIDNVTKRTFFNPSDLFVQSVELYDRKIHYELDLMNNVGVHVLQGFTNSPMVRSKSYPLWLGFFGGCVLVAVVLFLKFFSAYYKQYKASAKN